MLTVLTEKNGKISVLAKNIRRVKGRFGAGASFLCYSDLEVEPSRSELYYLRRATPIENFFNISESIEKLALATYMGQLASAVIPDFFTSDSNSLSLVLNTFYVLSNTDKDLKLLKSIFELRLMAEEGCAPQVTECAKCGGVSFPMHFLEKDGVVECNDCTNEGTKLNEALYKSIIYILNADLKKLYNFTLGKENTELLSKLSEQYCIYQLGKPLPSLEYYKQFI